MPRASRSNSLDLGLDIVEIGRVRRLGLRSPRFLPRVFTPEEIAYCGSKRLKWQHFAVRFAAKEAVWKALGRAGLTLKDISIRRDASGKPSVLLKGRPCARVRVSLSHSDLYAAAVAVKLA